MEIIVLVVVLWLGYRYRERCLTTYNGFKNFFRNTNVGVVNNTTVAPAVDATTDSVDTPAVDTTRPNVVTTNTTITAPAVVSKFNWKYVWQAVGIIIGAGLLYFIYVNYNNILTSDWYSGWYDKHVEFSTRTVPYAFAIVVGLLTFLVRKTNKSTYALIVGIVGILLAFWYKNPVIVREIVFGSMTGLGKTGKDAFVESTKGLSVKDFQPLAPYSIALITGVLTYYTSNGKKYKNFSLAIFTFVIALVAIHFWLNPSYLMTEENPLRHSSMVEILFQNGSSYLSAVMLAIAVYLVYVGHAGFAVLLTIMLMVFTACQ